MNTNLELGPIADSIWKPMEFLAIYSSWNIQGVCK